MPVITTEIELNDGTKVEVRQASGFEKLPFESMLAKAFRKFRHFGVDNTKWSEDRLYARPNAQISPTVYYN